VDLPPVVDLRRRLLPPEPRMTAIPASALDRGWLDVPDPARGVFISAEGLFMYFDRDEVFALIAGCAARFTGGQLFFDSIPPWLSRRTLTGGPRGRPRLPRYRRAPTIPGCTCRPATPSRPCRSA
jgi:O-methyltransferase involved in polyketide biosynthesis